MPRRSLLSASERASLLALPEHPDDLIRHYSLSEPDLSLIRQRRGEANRLGFAIQLCLLRYPGYAPLRAISHQSGGAPMRTGIPPEPSPAVTMVLRSPSRITPQR